MKSSTLQHRITPKGIIREPAVGGGAALGLGAACRGSAGGPLGWANVLVYPLQPVGGAWAWRCHHTCFLSCACVAHETASCLAVQRGTGRRDTGEASPLCAFFGAGLTGWGKIYMSWFWLLCSISFYTDIMYDARHKYKRKKYVISQRNHQNTIAISQLLMITSHDLAYIEIEINRFIICNILIPSPKYFYQDILRNKLCKYS